MRIDRTNNAIRNIMFGGGLRVYQIIVPFLMRTAMIHFMGIEYLGLYSLFTSILQVLNLAELGVGVAMVYSMYEPIANDDEEKICALLKLYRKYYGIIGGVIAVLGLILLPFVPKLVKGSVPAELNIYVLYLMNLFVTVLSYWLLAYKNSLLTAHQRNDLASKVQIFTNTLQYIIQLIVIISIKNYYLYLLVALLTQIATNIITAVVASKAYPNYSPKGEVDISVKRQINSRIRDLFTAKVGGVIVNSVDTIVISAFLGLTALAIYQNYYFILSSVTSMVFIVFSSCTAGIGNSLIVETKDKNFQDLKKLTFIISWLSGFCASCLLCLYQPFMGVWVGNENKLQFGAVICFCIYYYIYEINQLLNVYKDAAGIWHEDRFRPLVTAFVNLSLNLIMVNFWGIYGVILSTVLSMLLVGMPWLLHNLFTVLFDKRKMYPYLKDLGFYVLVTVCACVLTYIPCSWIKFDDWALLLLRGIICCIVPNIVFLLFFHKKEEFRQCVQMIDNITKGKLKLEKRFLTKEYRI